MVLMKRYPYRNGIGWPEICVTAVAGWFSGLRSLSTELSFLWFLEVSYGATCILTIIVGKGFCIYISRGGLFIFSWGSASSIIIVFLSFLTNNLYYLESRKSPYVGANDIYVRASPHQLHIASAWNWGHEKAVTEVGVAFSSPQNRALAAVPWRDLIIPIGWVWLACSCFAYVFPRRWPIFYKIKALKR